MAREETGNLSSMLHLPARRLLLAAAGQRGENIPRHLSNGIIVGLVLMSNCVVKKDDDARLYFYPHTNGSTNAITMSAFHLFADSSCV